MNPPPSPLSVDDVLGTDPAVGWEAFRDVDFLASQALILLLSIALAAAIAYHPAARRRATTLDALEQPKTYLMYAMVGALVAIIVKVQPSMALVVFGIGGLLRFRTNVGEAIDTGRVILVTVVGLCCGLELFVVAALATLFGWILVWMLETRSAAKLVVQGITADSLARVAAAYTKALRDCDCAILAQDQHVKKGSIVVVFRPPRGWDRAGFAARIESFPPDERGTVDIVTG